MSCSNLVNRLTCQQGQEDLGFLSQIMVKTIVNFHHWDNRKLSEHEYPHG